MPHLVCVEEQLAAVQLPVETQDADQRGDCYDRDSYHVVKIQVEESSPVEAKGTTNLPFCTSSSSVFSGMIVSANMSPMSI